MLGRLGSMAWGLGFKHEWRRVRNFWMTQTAKKKTGPMMGSEYVLGFPMMLGLCYQWPVKRQSHK